MADYGLFIGWNRPIPGREVEANEVFQQSVGYWTKQAQEGNIENFEPVLLARHGGDLNGFFMVRGERAKILGLMDTEDFKNLMMRVDHIAEGFGYIEAVIGDEFLVHADTSDCLQKHVNQACGYKDVLILIASMRSI